MSAGMLMLAPFWSSFLCAALLAMPIYRLLLRMKSRQTVSQYAPEGHQTKQGTPTMGGLIIVAACLAGLLVAGALPSAEAVASEVRPGWNTTVGAGLHGGALWAALMLLLGFALIGFVDDFVVPRLVKGKRGLGWKQKFVLQVAFAVVATGLLLGWRVSPATATTAFLIVATANAYNFLDGLDALAGSVLIALCVGILALGTAFGQIGLVPVVSTVLIAGTIPFLYLNAPPAKVFMGDVGSLPIGALLGLLFSQFLFSGWVFYTPYSTSASPDFNPYAMLPLLLIGFVLIAELVPVPLQILWVKLFKRRLFTYTPIHHAFEKKGWAETRVVWAFVLTQIILCALAYTAAQWPFVGMSEEGGRYHYYYFAPEKP